MANAKVENGEENGQGALPEGWMASLPGQGFKRRRGSQRGRWSRGIVVVGM